MPSLTAVALRPAVPAAFERMTPTPTDAELLSAIARADAEAFRAFYERWADRVLAYVRRISRDRESVEDVVQEVFVQVWRRAASFRASRGDVPGWLYTITRNRLVDRWRRTGGRREDEGFDLGGLVAAERDEGGRVVDLAVRQALSGLGPEQREAIELAYFGGLTYSETAERLGLPLGTLKSRIRAGLACMRGLLDGESAG